MIIDFADLQKRKDKREILDFTRATLEQEAEERLHEIVNINNMSEHHLTAAWGGAHLHFILRDFADLVDEAQTGGQMDSEAIRVVFMEYMQTVGAFAVYFGKALGVDPQELTAKD